MRGIYLSKYPMSLINADSNLSADNLTVLKWSPGALFISTKQN